MSKNRRIVVVGGGISGLASAYYAQKRAQDDGLPTTITILEKDPAWGGKIRTERVDDFVIEGGPDTFLATKPEGMQLCRELDLAGRLEDADMSRRKVYVMRQGGLVEMPDGLAMMVPTKVGPMLATPLLSATAKLRMGLDLVIPPAAENGDESLGNFLSRRLGRQVYERLIEPLMSGIYAGDGDQLSLAATFPYLRQWERQYGSLSRGALLSARQRQNGNKPATTRRSVFVSPRTGLSELVEALLVRLQHQDLRAGVGVARIRQSNGGFTVRTTQDEVIAADAVIIAAPSYVAGRLARDLKPLLAEFLEQIPYTSTATVSLAYRETDLARPLDGHGYVIPRIERREALACTWSSTKFPHRAPEGRALLRVFIGRAGRSDAEGRSDEELLTIARQEVARSLGIKAEPLLTRVFQWPQSMPQYNLGHVERRESIEHLLNLLPGLQLAGAGLAGVGIPDCIASGRRAAEAAVAHLGRVGNNSDLSIEGSIP